MNLERNGRRPQIAIGLACFLGMVVSSPAILSINPLLLKPTAEEFGWGRGTISLAYLVAAPVMAALYMVVGPALDRFGVRRLLLAGYVLFGAATALLSQLNGSVAQLLVLKLIATSFATLPTGVAFGKVISGYFTARRGTMLGLCLGGGGGFGTMVMPLIGAQVLEVYGWRFTYVAAGLIAIVVGLIATAMLPPDSPHRCNSEDGAKPQAKTFGIEGSVARKSRPFVILFAGTLLTCMVLNGTLAHLSAILTDSGMTTAQSAVAMSVYAGAMICGQFGIGILSDRIGTPRIFVPVLCLAIAGLGLLHGNPSQLSALLGAGFVGAAAGSEYGLLPYMVTRYFGQKSFGQLYGFIYAAAAMGTGIGPYAMGAVFDMAGSYDIALVSFGVAVASVIVLFLFLPRYTFEPDGSVSEPAAPDAPTALVDKPHPAR